VIVYNCPLYAWEPGGGGEASQASPPPRALAVKIIKIEEKGEMCQLLT
jgi:hypothetical protein